METEQRHPNGHSHECNVWKNAEQCDPPDLTRECDCGKVSPDDKQLVKQTIH